MARGGSSKQNVVTDPEDSTILIAEYVGHEIPWTKPEDLRFDKMDMTVDSDRGICSLLSPPAVVTLNGDVRFLSTDATEDQVRALLTAQGGEAVDLDLMPKHHDGRLRPRKTD